MLRKAKAELEAEAAADHARQRERKARTAERQAAAQTVTRSGTIEARWPRDLDARGRMDRKIRSKAGQAIDALCARSSPSRCLGRSRLSVGWIVSCYGEPKKRSGS